MIVLSDLLQAFDLFLSHDKQKDDKLAEALSKYESSQEDVSIKYELESAFFRRYKKAASAELIVKMARVWGPQRGFRVYSSSLQILVCDYRNHSIIYNAVGDSWWARFLGLPCMIFLFLSGLLLASSGIYFFIFISNFLYSNFGEVFSGADVGQGVGVISVLLVSVMILVMGCALMCLAANVFLKVESSRLRKELAEEVNNMQSESW